MKGNILIEAYFFSLVLFEACYGKSTFFRCITPNLPLESFSFYNFGYQIVAMSQTYQCNTYNSFSKLPIQDLNRYDRSSQPPLKLTDDIFLAPLKCIDKSKVTHCYA